MLLETIISEATFLFTVWVFFYEPLRFTRQRGKGKAIYLTRFYHPHPIHRHLHTSQAITADGSPLLIASSLSRTVSLWFVSASH